ncbi:bifunctional diaminohydroxyphosphoribosylaminopyrimidine deaminase/5-amino-6-(5-phosphoribosylamino)uracil reductase RibD [Synoicihabitans lomoniglobus]|uniref:Riboflavin biosynthesis protein RibD n=1 Tax=Synoicihabitans lomoniglobus TaxID=2909285 RepID=A0AAF0CS41_9BACT|nr:bifunctional diaminohydroxyphosphoribosylaminopyrimidine deaminase/5-amino-6-(5-phosphoribosylamino)uracil reductase RibD [Opitutaceae bacterium LMO-M01]WED67073.1 bifunctional diaminohydroxyphosphoribosylaminopyrimidine deaminase/5-amino-6-(5-phosphoribosylamino)uracil reductase RibD [Opitutaceae bacterium LMO-M01]
MSDPNDEQFMTRALDLARQAWGETHPNPMVGAVLVERGKIVAEGHHASDGGPHAEKAALTALGRKPGKTATLYVTLEPCSTAGRTGACCDAIIAAGIKRVVVGANDANPDHAGRGLEVLRTAGVEVTAGVLERECLDLNLIFNHWISTGKPLVAAKTAVTIDGRIATRTGDSQWITNEQSRADVHHWRRLFPSIAVGAMTVLQDDPRLTARLPNGDEWCPHRFVFDGLLRTVVDRNMPRVYTDEFKERTIVVTTPHGGLGYVRKLENLGIKVWVVPSDTQRVAFSDFKARCAAEKITGVYVEGGAQLIGELMRARELDYLFNYRAPMVLADDKSKSGFTGLRTERLDTALRLTEVHHAVFGDDQLMRGRIVYPDRVHVDETVFTRV